MKRYIRSLLVAIIGVLLCGITVLASGYTATIQVINSSTVLTYPPVIVSQDNSYLVSNGYIASNGLDVQIKDNGAVVPLMLTDKQTLFVPDNLAANSTSNFAWTSGNTPVANDQIIVGNGGYITIPYSSSLELGGVFEVDISGYFFTSASYVGDKIFYKNEAFIVYVQADGYIRAAILTTGDAEVVEVTADCGDGFHDLIVSADGSDLYLYVDTVPYSQTSAISVPPNTNDYILMSDCTPYLTDFKINITP